MVRQGLVVTGLAGRRVLAAALSAGLVALLAGLVAAQTPAEPKKDQAQESADPIEIQPYRIRVYLAIDPETRIDANCREKLLRDWDWMIRRYVGAPWRVEFAPEKADPILAVDLEDLNPDALTPLAKGVDKLWLIRINPEGTGYSVSGREFDVSTHRLGPLQKRSAPIVRDAARVLFQFSLDLFSPYALVGERFGKYVSLTVRGSALTPATPVGAFLTPGVVFHPMRVVPTKDGKTVVREIPFTYLRVESVERAGAKCTLVSSYPNPFTASVVQKNYLAALGIKPGKSKTRLRFFTLPDKAPAAGYVLTAKTYPDGSPRDVGTTDREGRIVLEPGATDGLTIFRLMAGSSEPMREFPLMPGATNLERDVQPFNPKFLAVTLETKLDSLRDEVIDLVAIRARLEARLKVRWDGEDYDSAEAILKEIQALPSREKLADQVAKIKEDAQKTQYQKKVPIMTRTAQSQFTDLQALIERYLDDDLIRGYVDALGKVRNAPQGKAQGKGKAAVGKAAAPKK